MRAVFVWGIFLLAGATYCTEEPEKIQNKLDIPVWSPDWWPLSHPEWIPWPPSHPEWIPWPPQIPEKNEAVPGTPAAIEEFPGLVQVENGFGPFWAQGCAGSILTSRHVLTAARCVSGRFYSNRFRRIRAGSSTRNAGGVVVDFDSVIVHPSFDVQDNFFDSDVAIVRMRSVLIFGPSIQQASIVAPGFDMIGGLPVVLTGWGSTVQGEVRANNDLYKADLLSVDNRSCANTWSTLIPLSVIKVTSNMICIAQPETGGRNSDWRDLGAPVLYDKIVVGVMSWGNIRGNQLFPAVATAVSPYTSWIVENVV